MKRTIKKVAVLGAGVMGAQIAAHLANCRVEVVLFDLPAKEGDPSAMVSAAIRNLGKLKPPPLATAGLARRIHAANYDQDLALLEDCDLVIEAIAERLDWKESLYARIESHLAAHAILASNTSGLSLNSLAGTLSPPLRERFIGLHFFNPPRYMHLLEVIPCDETGAEVIASLEGFFVSTLGKGVVVARDTPNFIGNRIGVFSLLATMHHAQALEIPFEVVDQITGAPLGRPKSGTFRTADVVGLDVLLHVIDTLKTQLPGDPWQELYQAPDYVLNMVEQGALGQKTRKGIYINKGKQVFSPAAGDYVDADQRFDEGVAALLREPDWSKKIDAIRASDHPQARFIWACFRDLFHYCLVTLEEIAATARDVDFAMRWGFGWNEGPFEIMQQIGFNRIVGLLEEEAASGHLLAQATLPEWVHKIDNIHAFEGSFSPETGAYLPLRTHPVYARQVLRENVKGSIPGREGAQLPGATIFENDSACLWDGGDDIAVLSFKTKLHTINAEVLTSILQACETAERSHAGLVLWHPDAPFGVGADLKQASQYYAEGQFDKVVRMVENFQHVSMALKHCFVPTVAAVQGLALGGACEFQLHCQVTVAAQETYAGLVEAGVGLLPAGGGLKELALRAARHAGEGDLMPGIQAAFEATAMAKVSASGLDAMALGLMSPQDVVIANTHELLFAAKAQVQALAGAGYRPASRSERIRVAGRTGKANLMTMAVNMLEGHFISEHDYDIAERIADTLTGGAVEAGSRVSQDWLLKLEREHFLALLQNPKTQARIAHTLSTGKPLRN